MKFIIENWKFIESLVRIVNVLEVTAMIASFVYRQTDSVLESGKQEVDFKFFGLVEGHEKELGYFLLSELEGVRGPMGLPIERDLYWQPKTLEEIAPEMFKDSENGADDERL